MDLVQVEVVDCTHVDATSLDQVVLDTEISAGEDLNQVIC